MSICVIDECLRPVEARGWCSKHYQRWQRWGTPHAIPRPGSRPGQRRHEPGEHPFTRLDTPCREWLGLRDEDGYGLRVPQFGGSRHIHRWVWEQVHGPTPPGRVIRHRCDNPPCFRYDHLAEGSVLDNAADMVGRGRSLKGERHNLTHLTDADVLAIRQRRSDGAAVRDLMADFHLSKSATWAILKRKTWRHLLDPETKENTTDG